MHGEYAMDEPRATLILVSLAIIFMIVIFGLIVARLVERQAKKQSIELQA